MKKGQWVGYEGLILRMGYFYPYAILFFLPFLPSQHSNYFEINKGGNTLRKASESESLKANKDGGEGTKRNGRAEQAG